MKIQAAPLPTLPKVPHNKGPLEVSIDFVGPARQDTNLGQIPKDFYTSRGRTGSKHTEFPNAQSPIRDGREIVRPQPVLGADGAPVLVASSKQIKAQADSALKHGIIGALIGAGAGLFLGAFPAIATGSGAVWGGAIAGGAALGGGIGALSVANDRVRLEWREQPILTHRLRGYTERVSEDSHTQKDTFGNGSHTVTDGYWHRFTPDVGAKSLGTYMEPMVVHYDARSGAIRRVEGELTANES
ncbi:MAG: hypothetical protein J0I12_07940 [Candidatus Eremiobacteraeota bacterium]|nr:hypothetical protein [Candidatus Eremiobacteraeota bacterium]